MLLLNKQAWIHSIKGYLAAMLAMYVSLLGQLSMPSWAMTTAYVVMQPVMGGTNSKGFYRIVGTTIAGVAVVALIPNLLHERELLTVALCLWMSGCLFISIVMRRPAAYIFLTAAFTTGFVGFPTLTSPENIFDIAVARVQEIFVGTLSAIVVSTLLFPRSIGPKVQEVTNTLMKDSLLWCSGVLEREESHSYQDLAPSLSAQLNQFDTLTPFIGYDDPRHGKTRRWIESLRAGVLGMLPVVASIDDRLSTLEERGELPPDLGELIDKVAIWIKDEALPDINTLNAIRYQIDALRTGLESDLDQLLRESLLLRLKELAEIWYDCRHLQRAINTSEPPPPVAFTLGVNLSAVLRQQVHHVDWPMAIFRALAPGATLFVYCMLWIRIGWPSGSYGAMLAGLVSSFTATQDDPVPSLSQFLWGTFLALVGCFVYTFGVFPALDNVIPMAMSLAPFLVLVGLLVSSPKWVGMGIPALGNFCILLSVQNTTRLSFDPFVNSSVSVMLGIIFTLIMTRLFRSMGSEVTTRRMLRQAWQLVGKAAAGRGIEEYGRFLSHMLDLLGLMAPRLADLHQDAKVTATSLMTDVRIGLNVLNLRRARSQLPAMSRAYINQVLTLVDEQFSQQSRSLSRQEASDELLVRLDAALRRLRILPASSIRDQALLGLVGLRQCLYPQSSELTDTGDLTDLVPSP